MVLNKKQSREAMASLVEKYITHRSDYISGTYNETQTRIDFINPFIALLGWDIQNIQNAPQYLREVIQEESLNTDEEEKRSKKKPDYALRVDGKKKLFLEAKKPSVNLLKSKESAFQIRSYGWSANLPISVITNFETLAIYDCRFKPVESDDISIARIKLYKYDDYLAKFDELYEGLSKYSATTGKLDEIFGLGKEQKGGVEPFDKYFLEQIENWREIIAYSLIDKNNELNQSELNYLIQQIINRIIFLRICEDRELEKYEDLLNVKGYEQLKRLFLHADKKYNSGLFDFIEDKLSLKVKLDDSILIQIFKELYYPRSPYTFAVVDARILSDIYELFLSKELILTSDEKIKIEEKPEIAQSQGAVPTPAYIVDEIIKETLKPVCSGKEPDEISKLRIADVACGSGIFLLSAYEFLINYHLQWYLENAPSKHPDKVIRLSNGDWRLTILEKNRILLNNIFGVDIDYQAVQVAKFSLLLKVLEDVTLEEINDFLHKERKPILPDLSTNIQWGNSLVDNSYYDFSNNIDGIGQVVAINPFDFHSSFANIFREGGFDIIIGNPPYTRIQNLMKYSPLEARYFESKYSPYKTAKSNNFDKYFLFMEKGLSLLKSGGILGFIVPHKFINIKAGESLREIISSKTYLSHITHFGVNQVFDTKTSTYTCILILNKRDNPYFTVEFVRNLDKWKYGERQTPITFLSSSIGAEPWLLMPPELETLFGRIQEQNKIVLEDVADIFVGVQTSADKIYIVKPASVGNDVVEFIDIKGKRYAIEKSILQPCLLDVALECFEQPKANAFIIFPYKIIENKAILYSQKEMKKLFPTCWIYLNDYKDELEKRNVQNYTEETWYKFGRSQSLTKFNQRPKLVWPVLSLDPRYSYDDQNIVFTGGGNGPYYALRPKDGNQFSIFYLMAILSHPVLETFIRARSSKFRGNYGSHGKQFIKDVPIKDINFNNKSEIQTHESIVTQVKKVIELTEKIHKSKTPKEKDIFERALQASRNRLNSLINELYGLDQNDLKTVNNIYI